MPIHELTAESFAHAVAHGTVLVECCCSDNPGHPTCKPCREIPDVLAAFPSVPVYRLKGA